MFKSFERIYVVFGMLYMAGALIPTIATQDDLSRVGRFDLTNFLAQIVLYGVLLVILAARWRMIRANLRFGIPLTLLCVLAILSCSWSSDPAYTFRRGCVLLGTTLFAFYVASRFEFEEQLTLLACTLSLTVFGSFVMVTFFPQYGLSLDLHWGDWKGVFPHKNVLGLTMVLSLFLFMQFKPRGLPVLAKYVLMLGSSILLVFSRSASAFVLILLLALTYPFVLLIRCRVKSAIPIWTLTFASLGLAVWLIMSNTKTFLDLLGRDASLTGRLPLWVAVIAEIARRPLLGYGFAVFWHSVGGESTAVDASAGWHALHAHNGYLDLCLDVGILGLGVFLTYLLSVIWKAAKLYHLESARAGKWGIQFLIFAMLSNCESSSLLRVNNMFWMLTVSTAVTIARNWWKREHDFNAAESEPLNADSYMSFEVYPNS